MISVLRSATPWMLAVMIGITTYSGMLAKQYSAEAQLATERAERTLERNERLRLTMEWQQEQLGVLHTAIRVRDEQLSDARDDIADSRDAAQELERDNDEIAEWADRDVDGGIVDWLRKLRVEAVAGGDDTDSAGDADDATARAEPSD